MLWMWRACRAAPAALRARASTALQDAKWCVAVAVSRTATAERARHFAAVQREARCSWILRAGALWRADLFSLTLTLRPLGFCTAPCKRERAVDERVESALLSRQVCVLTVSHCQESEPRVSQSSELSCTVSVCAGRGGAQGQADRRRCRLPRRYPCRESRRQRSPVRLFPAAIPGGGGLAFREKS